MLAVIWLPLFGEALEGVTDDLTVCDIADVTLIKKAIRNRAPQLFCWCVTKLLNLMRVITLSPVG
jgi:hypothetical protein